MTEVETQNTEYKNYLETRKDYILQQKEQIQEYAKYLMSVSCGIFGISFIFIEKMVKEPIKCKEFLLASWISFSIAIVAIILSFLLSKKAFEKEIDILDDAQSGKSKIKKNHWNFWVRISNTFSLAFILGIIFLFIFAYKNL